LACLLSLRPPPGPTLFPYTTLFRSQGGGASANAHHQCGCFSRDTTLRVSIRGNACGPAGHVDLWLSSGTREAGHLPRRRPPCARSEEHTSELQSRFDLVCRLLLEKK